MHHYNALDHIAILSCLTDDVEWVVPGAFHHRGKDAFDKEIENPAFEGKPQIVVTRITEEGDIVVAEGTVLTKKRGGAAVPLIFCDVFEMRHAKIRKLTSYLMPDFL
jgi:ketosteroid isomerase-like protein